MLDGPWLEKRPANRDVDWVVTLPEDDRKYMEIILALAHGSFRRIPRTIVLDDLYQLCFCIDKYDISEGLIPWVDKWCGGVEARVEFTTIGAEDAAKVLWIGWVLGNLELVERSAERLFESTKSSEVAKLTRDPTGVIRKWPWSAFYPAWLTLLRTGDIQKMQLEAAREIVSVVHDHWLELTAPDELGGIGMRCKSNDRPASRELCDEATLGKLTVSLAREGFQDTKIFDDFDIMSLLQAVSRIAEDNASLEALGSKHKLCGPGEEIRGLQEVSRWALPAPVTTAAYKIVTARAKKIGTDDYWADVEVE
ncbi:hypothetical protein RB595_007109 [Gaeumannomyces hyphopodioides]